MSVSYNNVTPQDRFIEQIRRNQQCVALVSSLHEYVNGSINKISSFLSGAGDYASIMLPADDSIDLPYAAIVSQSEYSKAMSAEPDELVSVAVDANDTVHQVRAGDLLDAFSDSVSELEVQSEYLSYVTSVEVPSQAEFISVVKAKYATIRNTVLDKYSDLMASAGSMGEALTNFVSLSTLSQTTQGDVYVHLVDRDAYTGNVLISAIDQVWEGISSFFSDVADAVKHLTDVFSKLWDALKRLTVWLLGKAYSHLLTSFAKGSVAPAGRIDYPLLQVSLTANDIRNCISFIIDDQPDVGAGIENISTVGSTQQWPYFDGSMAYDKIVAKAHLQDAFLHLCEEVIDGEVYRKVYQTMVSFDTTHGLCLELGRSGADDDADFILSVYFVTTWNEWESFQNDEARMSALGNWLQVGMTLIGRVVPVWINPSGETSLHDPWQQYVLNSFWGPSGLGQGEMATCFPNVGVNLSNWAAKVGGAIGDYTMALPIVKTWVFGFLYYMCAFGRGFRTIWYSAQDGLYHETDRSEYILNLMSGSDRCVYEEESFMANDERNWEILVTSSDPSYYQVFRNAYRPYSTINLVPCVIHYQPTAEQAREVVQLVLTVIVAAVVAVAAVKIFKWKKQRMISSRLASEQVGRTAWAYGDNPTPENLQAYNQAYKKNKRMEFFNKLLGMGESAATSYASDGFYSLSNSTNASASATSNSFSSLEELIRGR